MIGGGDRALDRIVPDCIQKPGAQGNQVQLRNPRATRPWQTCFRTLEWLFKFGNELVGKPPTSREG